MSAAEARTAPGRTRESLRASVETTLERSAHAPDVSVVIPTRDRPDMLERCLKALANQTLSPDRYEIVVVDDGPDPETRDVVSRIARVTKARIVYVPGAGGKGPAAARNTGWRHATAPVIAFTDDDTVPDPGWLEAGLAALEGGADAASGRLIMPLGPHPTDYEKDASKLANAEFVTANCFCRTGALRDVHGFDERFPVAWREDADLQFSLIESGRAIAAAPDAVVLHPVRSAPWGASLRQQSKTEYNALLYKKHPRLYREHIGHSPRWYYVAVGSAAGALFALMRGRRLRAAILAAIWGALTAGFSLKRLAGTSTRPSHIAEMAVTSALIPFLSLFRRLRGSLRFRTLFW